MGDRARPVDRVTDGEGHLVQFACRHDSRGRHQGGWGFVVVVRRLPDDESGRQSHRQYERAKQSPLICVPHKYSIFTE